MPLLPARSASCRWRAEDGAPMARSSPNMGSAGARGISLCHGRYFLSHPLLVKDAQIRSDYSRSVPSYGLTIAMGHFWPFVLDACKRSGGLQMDTRKIAIACQGGGIHEAFTCGVLNRILKAKEDEEGGIGDMRRPRRFEIYGLSGTSEAIEQAPEAANVQSWRITLFRFESRPVTRKIRRPGG